MVFSAKCCRILGFRRVPPSVGRKLHIIYEIDDLGCQNYTGHMYHSSGELFLDTSTWMESSANAFISVLTVVYRVDFNRIHLFVDF
jgi:hypothetical protein